LAALVVIAAVAFWAPWKVESRGRTIQVGNLQVTCGPDQQPMVRQLISQGEQYGVECVNPNLVSMPGYVPVSTLAAPQPGAGYVPAGYTPAVYTRPAPAPARTVSAPAARTASAQEPVRKEGRSWQKTALIIGGSTGAGAGIGGIAGGKKGALIGAAIGGGSAAIYEAIKRR
jgi:hypothetical protein